MMGQNITRRETLAMGALGLTLPQMLSLRDASATPSSDRCFGRAKSCIVVFAWGGLSHIDTFDLKPGAGSDIKSAFGAIPTTIPGYHVCEHLPHLAKQVHRMSIVRSMHHNAPSHRSAAYWNLTGHAPQHPDKNWPRTRKDWPSLGSMVSYANRQKTTGMPGSVALPYPIYDGGFANGQHAGFLGMHFDPVIVKPENGTAYDGVSPSSGHVELEMIEGIDQQRLLSRRSLLESLSLEPISNTEAHVMYRERALDMMLDNKTRNAFNLENEPESAHRKYGKHICGQSMLMARKLALAGVPLVTVYAAAGDLNGSKGAHFDTHANGYSRLRDQMLPPLDQSLAALLDDLHETGAIDETLVVLLTEFGRTPKLKPGGGRDHYPNVYTVALAGAGVSEGLLYGSSDNQGAFPADLASTPADLHATIFHALGIEPGLMLHDQLNRPLPMCDGQVLPLFG